MSIISKKITRTYGTKLGECDAVGSVVASANAHLRSYHVLTNDSCDNLASQQFNVTGKTKENEYIEEEKHLRKETAHCNLRLSE